jgi:hypothetical protein
MFSSALVRTALISHFILDRKPLIRTRKKTDKISEGEFILPSGMQLRIFPKLERLDKSAWQKVVPADNFFLQWEYLLAFEKIAPSNVRFHYAIISEDDKPIAAFYFQVIHLSAEEISFILQPITSSSKIHGVGNGIREWLKKCREDNGFQLLISGNNFISGEYGVGMKADADPKKIFQALAETVKIITANDREHGKISAILVKDYFENTAHIASDNLRSKRYHRFLVEPEMIISLQEEWNNFENYISSFSKKYRNRAKSVLKKTEQLEVIELSGAELENSETEIFQLYKNVCQRAKFRLSVLHPDYFSEMKKSFPEIFRIFGYRLNGMWVAFRSSFHLPTHLEAHFIGIDYAVNKDLPLYQRVLYDFILEGIESKSKQVFLGRTAAEIKSTVGAIPHDLVCYIRHRNGISNQVIRPFIDYLKPSPWVPRNPFKE